MGRSRGVGQVRDCRETRTRRRATAGLSTKADEGLFAEETKRVLPGLDRAGLDVLKKAVNGKS